ncbi:protein trichome birefringence-like 3 isoform X2 [Magnolia sinica]|uniref:protein trichome birefringence-like 3 isoform X2 n=1 Tax=Magnolia sinica TaxID=86752 RepID=UPI002659EB67|nr:protein trichome birefringence-like 3 isoform X2 [Magnolia sinica]
MMKPSRRKVPLSIVAVIVCAFAFSAVLYMEDIGALTRTSILKITPCSTISNEVETVDQMTEFDPDKCDVTKGRWVFNISSKPFYSDRTCPYLDKQVSCRMNGRSDGDYRYWEWQPDECNLPRFDGAVALERLRGKRLMFVGDSLQRGQWQSFVCLVESHIPEGQKSIRRGRTLTVFKAKEYNATIEFYWAPFLVESNSDLHVIPDPNDRILRVDSIRKHAKNWIGVDILVFNTYVWWMSGLKIKSLWGSFANGEDGFEELDAPIAYRFGLKTWANWVDSTVNPNKTRVFFTTMSPTHMRSADWHNMKGIRCYNETRPVLDKGYWGSGSDLRMMKVVTDIVNRMKVPVSFVNITQLSEHRIDGHTSVYTEYQGNVLTDEQKSDPQKYADCIHWCLPGVPDTWNQVFYAYL